MSVGEHENNWKSWITDNMTSTMKRATEVKGTWHV